MTGVMFAFAPIPTLILLVLAILLIIITRLVSLASLLAYTTVLICSWALKDLLGFVLPQQIFMTIFPLLIIFLHRENIKRLIKGEESRLDIHKKSEY
jgi:glycerol-3-phosphate acyltransferase PlsY